MLKILSAKILLVMLLPLVCLADSTTNNLLARLKQNATQHSYSSDTLRISLLNKLSANYRYNNADSSLFYAKQALALARKHKYFLGQATSLDNIGSAYYVLGSYFPSLEAASQLTDISVKENYQPGIANAYQLRGLIYLLQDEFDDAIIEFNKALKVFRQLDNKAKIARMLFDLGLCYDEKRQPDKAFKYLKETLGIGHSMDDFHIISMAYNRMGETYFHMGNFKNAIVYYKKVLTAKYQDKWENAFAYSGLAQAQLALGKYDQAIINAGKSVALSHDVNSLWDEVRALKILATAYAAAGNYKLAYDNYTLMNRYNDSIINDNKQKKLNYLHLKQQRSDNLRLEKENEIHRQKSNFNRLLIVGIGLLTICISIFAFIISRSNVHKTLLNKKLERKNKSIAFQKEEISRQNTKLDELNKTKNQLFSVISHDLRSPFASLVQTMDLIRSGDINSEERDMIFDRFYNQVTHITLMVNNLLTWANSQLSGIKSEASSIELTEIMDEVLHVSGQLADDKKIKIIHENGHERVAFADAAHVKIIMQNILGNAIKFTPKNGSVSVTYSENSDFQIVHITDTGVGISPEKMHKLFKVVGKGISGEGTNQEMGAGIGLLMIKQFIDVNNGRIKIHSTPGEGTEVLVYLPKQA